MNLGIVDPYLDTMGGGERYMLTLASHLSMKHDVHLFWNNRNVIQKARDNFHIDLNRIQIVPEVFSRTTSLLKKIQKSSKYDLIIFLTDGSIPVTFANRNILHFQRPFQHVGGASIINQLKLKRFDTIVCNSYFTKNHIDQEYRVDSVVIYPPVAIHDFKQGAKKQIILNVSRFQPVKKHREMIRIFKKLQMKLPKWKLHLAGGLDPEDEKYFKEVKKEAAHDSSIVLLPNVSFNTIQTEYAHASIYLHATGFGENEEQNPELMEHFGIAPVEAMASGCIPILYNGGGLREIVTDRKNGLLWETEEECVEKVLEIVNNAHLQKTIRTNVIIRSKDFDQKKFITKFEQLI